MRSSRMTAKYWILPMKGCEYNNGVGIACMERGGLLCQIIQWSLVVLLGGIDTMYDVG